MEAGKNLLSSSPSFLPRAHHRNCPPSVLMIRGQAAPTVTSRPIGIAQDNSTSVLLQGECDEYRSTMHTRTEEKTSLAILDHELIEVEVSICEENTINVSYEYIKELEHQLLHSPSLWYLSLSLQPGKNTSSFFFLQSSTADTNIDVELQDSVALDKKPSYASKNDALLAKGGTFVGAGIDESFPPKFWTTSLVDVPIEKKKTVRSTRLLERKSKKRRVPNAKVMVPEISRSRKATLKWKTNEGFDKNDPFRKFLLGPEKKQLLSFKEESELIIQVQDLMRLEEVKGRLQSQLDREPTLAEWADAAGLSCRILRTQLQMGNKSREKLINSNLRMVVHISKQYQGRGLSFQDLLQEGSRGLIKSVEKFKPQPECRFASYAYWWIRQALRRAIVHNSRTVRLPEHVYDLLSKVREAKRFYTSKGHHNPTEEEVAEHVGIAVQKLQQLQAYTRPPISMQQQVWADQKTTFQDITADTHVESPDVVVAKQMMRQHVRHLLSVLDPRERKIIRLRYGILDGKQKTLSDIGLVMGLSMERIRQLEGRAIHKLKQCFANQGLGAYADLLI